MQYYLTQTVDVGYLRKEQANTAIKVSKKYIVKKLLESIEGQEFSELVFAISFEEEFDGYFAEQYKIKGILTIMAKEDF